MDYKYMPLYQKISNITRGVKENLVNMPQFKYENIQEYKKVLVGKGNIYSHAPVGTEFDFVAYRKSNFIWHQQQNKDDVSLIAKVIYKTSIDSLKSDIEQELFKFHSVRALRKLIIIVNTVDEKNKGDYLVPFFIKNYEVLLNYPPYLNEGITLDKCPLCGTNPSRVEPWFYNEETEELLPVVDFIDETTYFRF